ncbi:MAG: hypothetical protein A2268_07530 [Candidatus Raymondbacteria bacterium RifOxyA12_full_50_37]|uniref:Uncharacterized protein n=1 Tax=Candidatus Raymondbacteria bacterium RIFOXYD12_FULL_49_13 TaxID=1817890 RepID=A0A1F7FEH0_UNCRA|nr:MAG: hypothetical protein A2268_07530 [Candidatus Raymondbacteria bacterium RifOxyA12_full_50_37]OGJ97630.1 MAG: hypothetical protein A2453_02440 [Candidatus Raymondbacteria bacterium RIFOXYC2_FULL_50_21]OGK05090.1 MAG: hypothetical protein A2519_22690 [Candidatus Raymondbacteria bacterium RIFOXYD12_FULL_49_13]
MMAGWNLFFTVRIRVPDNRNYPVNMVRHDFIRTQFHMPVPAGYCFPVFFRNGFQFGIIEIVRPVACFDRNKI